MFRERVQTRAPRADIAARNSLLAPVRKYRSMLAEFQLPVARARVRQVSSQPRAVMLNELKAVALLLGKVEAAYRGFLAETADLTDADGVLADLDASFRRLIQILRPQARSLPDS
jgi:hypothetical protein